MPTIVEQIQADAINGAVRPSTLLRKAKLAAVKLGLPSVESWVESELNGYRDELPDYRILMGQPRAFNPVRGWIPIGGNAQVITMISQAHIAQPIAGLEELVTRERRSYMLLLPYLPQQLEMLYKLVGTAQFAQMGIELSAGQFADILDRVRNLVLDWALELERQGIMGTEIGFDAHDKSLAHDKSVHFHIGSIGNVSGPLHAAAEGPNARINVGTSDKSKNKNQTR
jgi:hypothetical protein